MPKVRINKTWVKNTKTINKRNTKKHMINIDRKTSARIWSQNMTSWIKKRKLSKNPTKL